MTPDRTLDITTETCPMTYVRVRLALDRLDSGMMLLVLLAGDEPERNVPHSARIHGHTVLSETRDDQGVTHVMIQKR